MANQTIDVEKLLRDAERQAAEAKRRADAAAKAAEKAKLTGKREEATRQYINQGRQRISGLQGFIDDDMARIRVIISDITASGGKITPAQSRDLRDFQKRVNDSITEQNRIAKELDGLVAGTLTLADDGSIIPSPKSDAATELRPATGASTIENYMMGKNLPPTETPKPDGEKPKPDGEKPKPDGTLPPKGGNYTGSGKPGSLLKKDGKPFTGTYQGKKYEKGVLTGGLDATQQAMLGTYGSKFLIDYFKENKQYTITDPYDPKKREISIYDYFLKAAKVKESAANVESALKNTFWFKDENERYKGTIYALGKANGINLDNTRVDRFRDLFLGGVKSLEEIKYDLGVESIKTLNLDKLAGGNIANAIRGGMTLSDAVSDYAKIYTDTFGISAADFNPADSKFLSFISNSGTSLYDFSQKLKRDWQYISRPDVQTGINAYAASLSQTYRQYGLALNATTINKMATDLYLGDTSTEEVNNGIMKIAADTYAPFRDRILNGENPLSLASPYISAMSQILEVPDGMLDLEDPTIRSVMMGGANGTAMPLWQFEQNMYKDNRWQYTSNARKTMDSVTIDTLTRFGLMG